MLPRSINVGPLTIHLYGLIIAVAILAGWLLAKKRASLYKVPEKIFDDPIWLVPLILGIVGARAYHVIDFWSIYSQNLTSIFYITRGGLGILGGLAGAFLGFLIVAKFKKLDVLAILDLASPSLLLGQAIGRLANFVNQEGFGPPTQAPWGVFIDVENRPLQFKEATHFHPTFFYETAIDGVFLYILLSLSKKFKLPGQTFALYLILYSVGRFIVEFWRIDTATIGEVKVAHIFTIIMFLVGLWLFNFQRNRA